MAKKKSIVASLTRSQSRSMGRLTQNAVRVGKKITRSWAKAAGVPDLSSKRASAAKGLWLPGMAMGPGGTRQYALFVPHALNRIHRKPAPLMVMLHGCGQLAAEFANLTCMSDLAAREGFLVLYPQQDVMHNGQHCWNWWDTQVGVSQAEAGTLMQAILQVSLSHGVDRDRVAIAGLSAGASMAALMGAIYLDRFCAVAMHSGVAPGAARSGLMALAAMQGRRSEDVTVTAVGKAESAAARHRRLPPMLVIQGDADLVVRRSNGVQAADLWAQISGARARAPKMQQRGQRLPWQQTDFYARGELSARLCEVRGLGHAWSGGLVGRPFSEPRGPNASLMIWRFAQAAALSALRAKA